MLYLCGSELWTPGSGLCLANCMEGCRDVHNDHAIIHRIGGLPLRVGQRRPGLSAAHCLRNGLSWLAAWC